MAIFAKTSSDDKSTSYLADCPSVQITNVICTSATYVSCVPYHLYVEEDVNSTAVDGCRSFGVAQPAHIYLQSAKEPEAHQMLSCRERVCLCLAVGHVPTIRKRSWD